MAACRATSIAARLSERPGRRQSAGDPRCRAHLQRHAELARRRRCRVRHAVDRGGAGIPRGSRAVLERSAAASIAAWRCRSSHMSIWFREAAGFSPNDRVRAVRQFLLRRLRQQLRRSRQRETLSRDLQPARRGAERDRRPEFREVDGRAEPAAASLSIGSARPGFTCRGCGRRCLSAAWRRISTIASCAARRLQRRRPGRLQHLGAVGARPDAVDRRRDAPSRAGTRLAAKR